MSGLLSALADLARFLAPVVVDLNQEATECLGPVRLAQVDRMVFWVEFVASQSTSRSPAFVVSFDIPITT